MVNRRTILVMLSAMMLGAAGLPCAVGETESSREYQVKAAFLYNFIKFVEWPEQLLEQQEDEPITIGILGKDPFGKAFEPLAGKLVENKKVVIRRFKGLAELRESTGLESMGKHPEFPDIKQCRVLFICRSENKYFEQIIKSLKGQVILTVGDSDHFLEAGGVINFLLEDQKVRFEICQGCAEEAMLKMRSQLLRLARRVLKDKSEHTDKH